MKVLHCMFEVIETFHFLIVYFNNPFKKILLFFIYDVFFIADCEMEFSFSYPNNLALDLFKVEVPINILLGK